jgi:hypothetical protein
MWLLIHRHLWKPPSALRRRLPDGLSHLIDQAPLELNKRLGGTIARRACCNPRILLTANRVPDASVEDPLHQFGGHQERGHYGQQICEIGGGRMHEFEPLAIAGR